MGRGSWSINRDSANRRGKLRVALERTTFFLKTKDTLSNKFFKRLNTWSSLDVGVNAAIPSSAVTSKWNASK